MLIYSSAFQELLIRFILMDLISQFHLKSSVGNCYALTFICILTSYVVFIPIKSKSATDVVKENIDHIYVKFAGSIKILSYNETEFKIDLFASTAEQLRV